VAPGLAPAASLPGALGVAPTAGGGPRGKWVERPKAPLVARAYLRLGIWQWALREQLDEPTIGTVGGGCGRAGGRAGGRTAPTTPPPLE
jgi:hypothetical protein